MINWFANQRKKYSKNKCSYTKHENSNEGSASNYNIEETNSSMIKMEESENFGYHFAGQSGKVQEESFEKQSRGESGGLSVKSKRIFKDRTKINAEVGSPCKIMKEATRENIRLLTSMSQNMPNLQKYPYMDPAYAQRLGLPGAYPSNALNYYGVNAASANPYMKPGQPDYLEFSQARRDAFMKVVNMQKKWSYLNNMKQARDYYMLQMKYNEMKDAQSKSNYQSYYYPNYMGCSSSPWGSSAPYSYLQSPSGSQVYQPMKTPFPNQEAFPQHQVYSLNAYSGMSNYSGDSSPDFKSYQALNIQPLKAEEI